MNDTQKTDGPQSRAGNLVELTVERREELGKNPNRRLRGRGLIPAVVYGGGREPVPIQVDRKRMQELIKAGGGEHAVFLLRLAGTDRSRHTMIRQLDVDPLRREIQHIDFQRVLLTEKVRVPVAIVLLGIPVGVKVEGGLVDFVTREVEVECLPTEMPQRLELDIAPLHVGQHREAKDLPLPQGVALLGDGDRVLVSIAHTRAAEAAEAGTAPTLIEAERAEPEVIRRGKTAAEEEA